MIAHDEHDAYRLYKAVSLHFDLKSSYDIRRSEARLKSVSMCPKWHLKIFQALSNRFQKPSDLTLTLAWVSLQGFDTSTVWLPLATLDFIGENPEWLENHKMSLTTPKFEESIRIDAICFKDHLESGKFLLKDFFGMNPFSTKKTAMEVFLKTSPYFIIGLLEALDMWTPSVVQCITIKGRMALQMLYRYRRFIGDDLTAKAVKEVQSILDIPNLKSKLVQMDNSSNQQKEHDEWQALFLN